MLSNISNEELANNIADNEGELAELLRLAQTRLGDDSELYCVSSPAIIEFVLSNRHSSLKIVWLREIRSRLIYIENKNLVSLFDVRNEDEILLSDGVVYGSEAQS